MFSGYDDWKATDRTEQEPPDYSLLICCACGCNVEIEIDAKLTEHGWEPAQTDAEAEAGIIFWDAQRRPWCGEHYARKGVTKWRNQ